MMTATGPSAIEIKRHGATLALAIHVIRSDGRTVAPFKGGTFRVGDGAAMEVCSAADIHGMAAKIANKRGAAAIAPRFTRNGHEITRTADRSPPGRSGELTTGGHIAAPADQSRVPAGDPGQPGGNHAALTPAPEVARPATPVAQLAASPLGALCGCGMLRSHGGRCWHRRGLPPPPPPKPSKVARDGNIAALWAEIDALKLANETLKESNARLERAFAELRGQMSMEGLR